MSNKIYIYIGIIQSAFRQLEQICRNALFGSEGRNRRKEANLTLYIQSALDKFAKCEIDFHNHLLN